MTTNANNLLAAYNAHPAALDCQVPLFALRAALPKMSHEAFDAALLELRTARVVTLSRAEGRYVKPSAELVAGGVDGPSGRLVYAGLVD